METQSNLDKSIQNFNDAYKSFIIVFCKSLRIDKLINFINNKLK